VIESAKTLLGKAPNSVVYVNGKRFILDCIGTVSAVYWRLDIDITKDFALYNGNGDRTDDPRTHAGIVLAVDADGTIHYVHENLYRGVMIEVMNLRQPAVGRDDAGKVLNSGLAIATRTGGPRPEHWLSGDVFDAFGDVLAQRAYFLLTDAAAEPTEIALEP
jgi:hypothetical protein